MSVWKVILATLVIFSTGAITGVLVSRQPPSEPKESIARPDEADRPGQGSRPDRRKRLDFMKRFGEELELSPEQSAKIEFILAESQERTRELWEEVAPQMREEVKATQEEIRSVLTPQQQEKFEELMKKRRHDRERKDPPHNPPPGDPPPGPPPPDRDAPTAS